MLPPDAQSYTSKGIPGDKGGKNLVGAGRRARNEVRRRFGISNQGGWSRKGTIVRGMAKQGKKCSTAAHHLRAIGSGRQKKVGRKGRKAVKMAGVD